MTTVGGIETRAQTGPFAAHHLAQFVPDNLDDLMPRGQTLEHFLPDSL